MSNDDYKTSWKSKGSRYETSWGYSIHWAALRGINGKCLFIQAGKSTSLKYYTLKDEILFLRKGKAKIIHGDEGTVDDQQLFPMRISYLNPGELMNIQQGCPYKIVAIEDCEIFEIGNHTDSPVVRLDGNSFEEYLKDDTVISSDNISE